MYSMKDIVNNSGLPEIGLAELGLRLHLKPRRQS